MIALSILMKDRQQPVILYFKNFKDAAHAQDRIIRARAEGAPMEGAGPVTDDYGHNLGLFLDSVEAVMVSDVKQDADAQLELMKIQNLAQSEMQRSMPIMPGTHLGPKPEIGH